MSRDYSAWLGFLAERAAMPFAWGKNDCVTFAAGAVKALTGREALPVPVTWTTERGAGRILKRFGGLEAAVDAALEPIAPTLAQRGDVALVAGPNSEALMIVEGATLVGPDAHGVRRLPRARMVKAWRA